MSFYRYIRVKWIVIDELIYIFLLCVGAPHMWCGCLALCVRRLNTTQVMVRIKVTYRQEVYKSYLIGMSLFVVGKT